MTFIEIIGYIGALSIGLIMGLTGSGGSILSIPILAYLFHLDEKTATAYSLFIVGITALGGGVRNLFSKQVSLKSVLYFGVPAIVGVLLMRRIIIPVLPEVLFHIFSFDVTRRMFIFGVFGLLMLVAAYTMLHKPKIKLTEIESQKFEFHPLMVTEGFFLGIFMGLIGAGGGFLIVPALMLIAKLPIKSAISTSLVIVCMNSLVGFFLGDFIHMKVNWSFLFTFVLISLIGILIGGTLARKIDGERLKKYFAYFVILMALFVFVMEFIVRTMYV